VKHHKRSWAGRARDASAKMEFAQALFGEETSRRPFDAGTDRKTLQLCRQIERALILALSGECGDDVLREVFVESVEPMGGISRLPVSRSLASSRRRKRLRARFANGMYHGRMFRRIARVPSDTSNIAAIEGISTIAIMSRDASIIGS
jgi:hypothetical protein